MGSNLILDGGIALVTGAASGIGKETALAYAEAGAKGVVFADINYEGVQNVAEESKNVAKHSDYQVLAIKVDIGDERSVQSLVTTAVKEFGRIDYAVNSAGEPLSFTGRYGTRSISRGSIVLLGSTQSHLGAPGMISYTTGKHAILGIMKSAAIDSLALQSNIRVNAVCPGWVDTPMVQDGIKINPIIGHAISTMTPLKRAASPDEVADSIVFLSSPSASFFNGVALPIDAGMMLPPPPPLPAERCLKVAYQPAPAQRERLS